MHVGMAAIFQNPHKGRRDFDVYRADLALAEMAEPMGFESVWSVEHHFTDYTMCPDVLQFLTYMAGRTRTAKLGSMVVVLPSTTQQVSEVLRYCHENKVKVVPRGAGTSQCGQTVGEALVVDVSKHLRDVVGFDKNRAARYDDEARARIGALDALKAAAISGIDEAMIRVAKPPRAWLGIPYVETLGVALDGLEEPLVLYDGPARAGVAHFPQNVNIAAVLSLAGIGFDRTRLVVVADPHLVRNTHTITVKAVTGEIAITLENIPSPENPKTAWLACYSALAALKQMHSPIRYGT